MHTPFSERLAEAVARTGAPACVGIDPHLHQLPESFRVRYEGLEGDAFREAASDAVEEWALGVVDAVADVVPVIKPQSAFFEALGWRGLRALERILAESRQRGLLTLLDVKRGDIGSTADAYARATLDAGAPFESDAVTLSPYLGAESLEPFLKRCDDRGRGLFILVRTSNPGSDRWQTGLPLAGAVAEQLENWNASRAGASGFGPVGAVVAANLPDEVLQWRARMPRTWFLMPGYGAQGATASDIAPLLTGGKGALVSASRSVLFGPSADVPTDWRDGVLTRARRFVDDLRGVC